MADGIEDVVAEPARPRLVYPFEATPAVGAAEAHDIAPGVKWIRMPVPGPLEFINVWLIRDGEGWAIADTGMAGEETQAAWEQVFDKVLEGKPVTRVFATHMHPDHMGLAGWLTRRFGCRFWITRLEYLTCRTLTSDTGREAPQDAIDFLQAAGWGEESIDDYRAKFGGFGKWMSPPPDSFKRMTDGDRIQIGDHVWEVVVGRGHSPEHACLWCPELKLMISGDQVLPRISSNVSVFPTEPDNDPLSDWLASIASIKARVPDDTLVLPAHNDPFFGLHARLDNLNNGHEVSLKRLLRTLAQPKRAIDVFPSLFGRKIDSPLLLGMATGESLAHLNCLVRRGQITRTRDAEGVDWYQTQP